MKPIDLSKVRTYPLAQRPNLVRLDMLIGTETPPPPFASLDLDEVVARVVAARRATRPVIWMMGAHVVKSGLSRLLIDLMRRGIVTHVAGNGAVSIHDFELALIGETSEDVVTSLEDGTFGMAEETGALMNQAIREGLRDGLGYGAALGRFIAQSEDRFPFREVSVLYKAYVLGVPATIHVTVGADIIHQHPTADFGAIGAASGLDFRLFAASVSGLEGGVFLNFGSAVTGPEVFLKSLTIVRNLGHTVAKFTTANFDLLPLGDYHCPVGADDPVYYYRPRKNVINRPTSLGGQGYHITGDHRVTIPNLYHRGVAALGEDFCPECRAVAWEDAPPLDIPPNVEGVLRALVARQPALADVTGDLLRAFRELLRCFESGGTLFLCGNGGSMADALHISGELLKSYAHPRPLPDSLRDRLAAHPDGELLVRNLEPGLRSVVLGVNPSLASAVANDMPDRDVNLAQELLALARPGDVLLGISTSGSARNVAYAAQTAHALGMIVIALTGQDGGRLAALADVAVRAPVRQTDRAQELHTHLYHTLCEMLEITLFRQGRCGPQGHSPELGDTAEAADSVLRRLEGGDRRSIGRVDEVIADVRRNPVLFAAVFSGMLHGDPVVRMRCADAVEKITAEDPDYLRPFKVSLIRQVACSKQQEVRWHVAQMLPRLELDEEEREAAVEILMSYLDDRSKIVKTFAMQALADLALEDVALRRRVVELVEGLVETGSPAMKSRGRKLLAKLGAARGMMPSG